ncbi:hypothetical protein TPA0908_40840 [Micromonospora sp. AKA38]|nr:hypothetical protein TPA0908_40840 [Micromonospora sp. AKA38]
MSQAGDAPAALTQSPGLHVIFDQRQSAALCSELSENLVRDALIVVDLVAMTSIGIEPIRQAAEPPQCSCYWDDID